MLSRHPLPTTRPSAPTRRHQTRHWHLPLLPHPRRPRRHCCWPPPHRTNHHSCPRLTNLLTRCKHSARKRLKHLRHLAGQRPAEANLFLNCRGEPLTRCGVLTLVERYIAKLRVSVPSLQGKRISPHVVRHTTASHLLQAGVDINTIRAWLGHVSLDTTNIYAETDLATKKRALAMLAGGKTRRATGGWSRQPDVMTFLRAL